MSKKGKNRRAADEMRDVVKEIAAKREQAVTHNPQSNESNPIVGNTYYDKDGNAYKVDTIKGGVITAKRDGKKIPFQSTMFTQLVGLDDPDTLAANTAKGVEKVAVDGAAAAEEAANKAAAAQAAEAKIKAQKEAKKAAGTNGHKVSAMQVIRRTLAHNHNATVAEISKACEAAGVPKSTSTIATIMSDFKQTYQALLDAGHIRTLH